MADYRDLLRRAVEALPENNGNARRQVYDKARKALRNQLDAIQPELPSREKTFHRLQLEECIREVEHEATERILGGFTQFDNEALHLDRDVRKSASDKPKKAETAPKPEPKPEPVSADDEDDALNLADTPAADERAAAVDAAEVKAEAARPAQATIEGRPAQSHRPETPRGTSIEDVIREAQSSSGSSASETRKEVSVPMARAEPASAGRAGREKVAETRAMSSVREVEVEEPAQDDHSADPQSKIDRAIAMLDREVSGKGQSSDGSPDESGIATVDPETAELGFVRGELAEERSSGNPLVIFLVVLVLLLTGVGGAGYWAWREGYVDLGVMFGQATDGGAAPVASTTTPDGAAASATGAGTASAGPGNTAATPNAAETANTQLSTSAPATATTTVTPPAAAATMETNVASNTVAVNEPNAVPGAVAGSAADPAKIDERLPTETPATQTPTADGAPAIPAQPEVVVEGGQSLLLEASDQGTTGAVPYSGTVNWTRGVDELGQPTLVGKAKIPARNLGVSILVRRNADPTLPASHLIEIDFDVPDTFVGGGIARIAGVLLKNEELVQGVPLVGASARVVDNSFLFALSAAAQDETANKALLQTRKWLDLAMIYATGKQAIITLEKDAAAQKLFEDVMTEWEASAASPATPAAGQ